MGLRRLHAAAAQLQGKAVIGDQVGVQGVACLVGGTAAPAILGDLVDRYGWTIPAAIGVTAATYLACIVLSCFLRVGSAGLSGEENRESSQGVLSA